MLYGVRLLFETGNTKLRFSIELKIRCVYEFNDCPPDIDYNDVLFNYVD